MIEKKIRDVLEEKLSEEGFEDCFIVSVSVKNNSKVLVHIDCDSGFPIRKCVSVSRRVESFLDETLLLGEKYTLEVSSPGLDNPLLLPRQYRNNIGRDLSVKIDENTKIIGTLISSDEEGIVLERNDSKKNKKKSDAVGEEKNVRLGFKDFVEAKVIVKFNKKKK